MNQFFRVGTTILFAMIAGGALAEGDVAAGGMLADKYCVRCHDITVDGAFKTYPPSFASIAVFRDADQIKSRILFPQLHTPMPQMGFLLDPQNIDDLTAYIVSLENKPE